MNPLCSFPELAHCAGSSHNIHSTFPFGQSVCLQKESIGPVVDHVYRHYRQTQSPLSGYYCCNLIKSTYLQIRSVTKTSSQRCVSKATHVRFPDINFASWDVFDVLRHVPLMQQREKGQAYLTVAYQQQLAFGKRLVF